MRKFSAFWERLTGTMVAVVLSRWGTLAAIATAIVFMLVISSARSESYLFPPSTHVAGDAVVTTEHCMNPESAQLVIDTHSRFGYKIAHQLFLDYNTIGECRMHPAKIVVLEEQVGYAIGTRVVLEYGGIVVRKASVEEVWRANDAEKTVYVFRGHWYSAADQAWESEV